VKRARELIRTGQAGGFQEIVGSWLYGTRLPPAAARDFAVAQKVGTIGKSAWEIEPPERIAVR